MDGSIDTGGALRLDDWGVIRARGDDAASFLHAQLTQGVDDLDAAHARLAGYCSPKGRLLASFVVVRPRATEVLLACSADLLAATLQRLRMFVLRARCKIDDASAAVHAWGLAGPSALAWLAEAAPPDVWCSTAVGEATVVRLPSAAGQTRFLWLAPATAAAPMLPAISSHAWRWLEVQSAVPRIVAATADRFVPQMVNFELVGGVDFGKGCYPGQEVVARSQYRGSVKRRMALFDVDATDVQPADELFDALDPEQPIGRVVDAACSSRVVAGPPQDDLAPAGGGLGTARPWGCPRDGWAVLAEVRTTALAGPDLHLGAPDGPRLRRASLPYALPVESG